MEPTSPSKVTIVELVDGPHNEVHAGRLEHPTLKVVRAATYKQLLAVPDDDVEYRQEGFCAALLPCMLTALLVFGTLHVIIPAELVHSVSKWMSHDAWPVMMAIGTATANLVHDLLQRQDTPPASASAGPIGLGFG